MEWVNHPNALRPHGFDFTKSAIHNHRRPANWLLASILILIRARDPFAKLRIRANALLNCGNYSNSSFDCGNWYKTGWLWGAIRAQSPKPRV